MKTKSLLFAALVSISLATTSCQKEENIVPNASYFSNEQNYSIRNTTTEEHNAPIDGNIVSQPSSVNTGTTEKTINQPKSTTLPINIMQIDSDDVK